MFQNPSSLNRMCPFQFMRGRTRYVSRLWPPWNFGNIRAVGAIGLVVLAVAFLHPAPLMGAPGKSLVVVLGSDPATLNPFQATDAYGVRISHQLVHETLVKLSGQLEIVPGLASWKRVSPTRYRFTLRPGARFADGAPLEAEDAVATLRGFMDPGRGSPYGAVLREQIARIRATGPGGFEIELRAPYASFLSNLILPVTSRAYAGGGEGSGRLMGSGPFRLAGRRPGEILLERNPHHRPPAGVERVVFKVVKDENTRLLKFRKGDVDLGINVLPLDKVARFSRPPLKSKYVVHEAPGLSFQYLGFNLRDPILSKREVRRAIAHAIDVGTLISYRQKGHSTRATGLLPAGSPYTDPSLLPIPHDPARAEKLLEQAGFPLKNGRRFSLTYKTSTDRSAVVQARVIAADLRKVGVEVEVRSYEWGTFYADIKKGRFQLYSLRWIGVSDPGFLDELLHSRKIPPGGRNRGHYANPEVDAWLEKARLEADPSARSRLYRLVHGKVAGDLPYVSLWHNNNVAVVSRRVTGFRLHPSGGFETLADVRWKK